MAENKSFFPSSKIIGQVVTDRDGQRFEITGIDYDKEYIEIAFLEADNKKVKMSWEYFDRWVRMVLE